MQSNSALPAPASSPGNILRLLYSVPLEKTLVLLYVGGLTWVGETCRTVGKLCCLFAFIHSSWVLLSSFIGCFTLRRAPSHDAIHLWVSDRPRRYRPWSDCLIVLLQHQTSITRSRHTRIGNSRGNAKPCRPRQ